MTPTNKVVSGAVAGSVMVLVVWAIKTWTKVEMPAEAVAAAQTLITFALQWVVPDGDKPPEA